MLDAFGLSDPGCVRSNNEDFFLLDRTMDLYLVADGMGGAQAGEHASRLTGETVCACVQAAERPDLPVLVEAVRTANQRVLDEAESDPR